MSLSTRYMGLTLSNPLVASAGPTSLSLDGMRALADAGVGAIVMFSLFAEQIREDEARVTALAEMHDDSFAEALSFFPTPPRPASGARTYLDLLERAAGALDVPVIASLNAADEGGWTGMARRLADAGAAAIELNIYFVPGDPTLTGEQVEAKHLRILEAVKSSVDVPVAVKLSPFFSSVGNMCVRLDEAGADALVLFNRFLAPDIDLDSLKSAPGVTLSRPDDARLPRAWIAALAGRLRASLAASSGVDSGDDVFKYLLAGADVVCTTSALVRHGAAHAGVMIGRLREWLAHLDMSLDQARGALAAPSDGSAELRRGYVAGLERAARAHGAMLV